LSQRERSPPPGGLLKEAEPSPDVTHLSPSPRPKGAPFSPGLGEEQVGLREGHTFPDFSAQTLGGPSFSRLGEGRGELGVSELEEANWNLQLLTFQRPYWPPLPPRAQPRLGGGACVCVYSVFGEGGGDRLSF
uniref:Uncharacterized protein n=1 Tax=Equus asinus asinus TaxID=83772 RepID=A0A8C4L4J5_EQUAS